MREKPGNVEQMSEEEKSKLRATLDVTGTKPQG
jgi:hypothetical protein